MKKQYRSTLLFIALLAITQLMCSSWTRYGGPNGSNGITLCTHLHYQLKDGTPVNAGNTDTNVVNDCVDDPSQQDCNDMNAADPTTLPADYSLVSYTADGSFDCSSNVEKGIQHRTLYVIVQPDAEQPPTEDPAATEPPAETAPLKPFLTGAFTACDNVAGYVNFTIADDAPAYDPATFKVTFNNYPVSCAPAANNPKVFTCKYPPASYAPPAGVQVFIGEELVNEFDFNGGSICDPAPQPNNPNPTEDPNNTDPAAPTEDPGGSG